MVALANKLTVEEFFRLGPDHSELVDGEIIEMAPPGPEHGYIALRFGSALLRFVEANRLGKVFVETGYALKRDPARVRAPDISFVRASRLSPGLPPAQFYDFAPDLAIEIFSPSDTMPEAFQKAREYLDAGTTLVWLIDPQRKTVTVIAPGQAPLTLLPADLLDAGPILTGFTIPVSEVFS